MKFDHHFTDLQTEFFVLDDQLKGLKGTVVNWTFSPLNVVCRGFPTDFTNPPLRPYYSRKKKCLKTVCQDFSD